jgi:hypothetical protein
VNPLQAQTRLSSLVLIAAVLTAVSTIGVLQWRSRFLVAEGGFWFDHVTFELPNGDTSRLGGPITEPEKDAIRAIAESELRTAYADARIRFSADHDAFNRVVVIQDFDDSLAAGASRVLPPLGGRGAVSFFKLARMAIHYAPPQARRGVIIEGIGRGIGRSAAHEFAHQFLPDVNIHASRDDRSYEYDSSDREAQYYGPMHWDTARPALIKTFGR